MILLGIILIAAGIMTSWFIASQKTEKTETLAEGR